MRAASARVFVLMVLSLLVVPLSVWPQTGSGVVRGTVTDANQGIVPGVEVVIVNQDTNVSRRAVTNDVGIYHLGSIPIGNYQMTVQLPGFNTWTTQFEVQAGQTVVIDPQMQIGELSTTVDVVGAAPVINTEAMEVSDVKDFQRIQQLPLNGRTVSNLFDLTPGVEGGGNARVIGQKVGSLEISLDGMSIVDRFGGGIARVQPGLDIVQEFRIETVGSDARYSRPSTVTLVSRSGTNEFHGSIFETHRNNGANLRARQRQEPTGDAAKLIRNEFGVSAGGPIWLGDFYDGRDSTFWFFSYEGLRQRQDRVTIDAVATDEMWNGDLSNLVDQSGNLTTIYDPLMTDENGLRQPFPGNVIPQERIHPFARSLQALTAKPTNSLNPNIANNLETAYPVKNDTNSSTFKFDKVISESDNLSVRWTRSTRASRTEGGVFGNPIDASAGLGTSRQDVIVNNVSTNYTHTFNPTFLNELLVGVHRSNNSSGTLADGIPFADQLGLPNPFGATGWPTIGASGAPSSWDGDNRHDQALTAATFEDNVTWINGNHTIQFGGKFRREYNHVRELQQAQGSHTFGSTWTAQYDPVGDQAVSRTGNGFASLLLGLPTFLSNQFNRGFFYFRQSEIGLYAMDKWKVSPRLTVQLGLRWDKWTPYSEAQNRLVTTDVDTFADRFEVMTPNGHDIRSLPGIPPSVLDSWEARGLSYTTADAVGYPSGLFRADNNNFGPRVGLAYRLGDRTVLRGSYGEYFWTMPLSQLLQAARSNPPLNLRFTYEPNFTDASGNWTLRNAPGSDNFIGQADVNTEGIVPLSQNAQLMMMWDGRNWEDARSQAWNVSLEHEIFRDTALRLSYVGNHGSALEQRSSINPREAEFNYVARTGEAPVGNRDILLRENPDWNFRYLNRAGFSNTHSAQIEIERRYSDGIAFQWFYVFTRSLTTTDVGGFTSGNASINGIAGNRQVPDNLEIMGAPNLSYDDRLKLIYFNSSEVPAHRIRYNAIVDLPFGRGQRWGGDVPGFVNQLIGGWQVAAIGDWRGGLWNSVNASRFQFGDPTLEADERVEMIIFGRPHRLWFRGDFDPTQATNVTGGNLESLVSADPTQRVVRQLGPNADNLVEQQLADGTVRLTPIGDLYNPDPRAFFRGPGAWNVDFSLFKHFYLTETVNMRVTADFFNVFNHPLDLNPNNTTGLQDLSQQSNEPRTIQLSVRLNW